MKAFLTLSTLLLLMICGPSRSLSVKLSGDLPELRAHVKTAVSGELSLQNLEIHNPTVAGLRLLSELADRIFVNNHLTFGGEKLSSSLLIEGLSKVPILTASAKLVFEGPRICMEDFVNAISHLNRIWRNKDASASGGEIEMPVSCYERVLASRSSMEELVEMGFQNIATLKEQQIFGYGSQVEIRHHLETSELNEKLGYLPFYRMPPYLPKAWEKQATELIKIGDRDFPHGIKPLQTKFSLPPQGEEQRAIFDAIFALHDGTTMVEGQVFRHRNNSLHITRELGSGMFGTTFSAQLTLGGKKYDLVIKNKTNYDIFESLFTAAMSGHPHSVSFFGSYRKQEFGVPEFIILEKLEKTWREVAQTDRQKITKEHVIALAKTLAFMHAQGIVHRDFHGRNIMFDESNNARIIDYGLTRKAIPGDFLEEIKKAATMFIHGRFGVEIESAATKMHISETITELEHNLVDTDLMEELTVYKRMLLASTQEVPTMLDVARLLSTSPGSALLPAHIGEAHR